MSSAIAPMAQFQTNASAHPSDLIHHADDVKTPISTSHIVDQSARLKFSPLQMETVVETTSISHTEISNITFSNIETNTLDVINERSFTAETEINLASQAEEPEPVDDTSCLGYKLKEYDKTVPRNNTLNNIPLSKRDLKEMLTRCLTVSLDSYFFDTISSYSYFALSPLYSRIGSLSKYIPMYAMQIVAYILENNGEKRIISTLKEMNQTRKVLFDKYNAELELQNNFVGKIKELVDVKSERTISSSLRNTAAMALCYLAEEKNIFPNALDSIFLNLLKLRCEFDSYPVESDFKTAREMDVLALRSRTFKALEKAIKVGYRCSDAMFATIKQSIYKIKWEEKESKEFFIHPLNQIKKLTVKLILRININTLLLKDIYLIYGIYLKL